MKKHIFPLIITSVILMSCTWQGNLRECPDEHIHDRMPGDADSQYYIMNGTRREMKEFDVAWVEENCDIEVQEVW